MVLEGIVGGLLGGAMRLAPEVIKFFDAKDERKHELNMFKLQTDLEKVKGTFKVEEKYVDYSVAELNALTASYKEQEAAVSKSSQWVANLSALVRPGITYVIFGLYVLMKIAMIVTGISTGQAWLAVLGTWTEADMALLSMITSYWFVSRDIQKYQK